MLASAAPPAAATAPIRTVALTAIMLWLFFFACYNANGREIPTADSQAAKFSAINLVRRHALTLDGIVGRQQLYAERLAFFRDRAGHWRNAYPLPPVLEAAGVAALLQSLHLLRLDAALAPEIVAKLTASAFVSLAATLAFLTALPFCGLGRAVLVAVGFALGTGLWPVASQTLWQHEATIWSLMAAICLWQMNERHRSLARSVAIGVLLGWSVSARPQTAPLVAVVTVGIMRSGTRGQRIATLLPLVAVAAVFVILNVVWFGRADGPIPQFSELNMSIHRTASTWQWPLRGTLGLLFSPSRGLLIFSPIVLVVLAARGTPPPQRTIVSWTLAAAAVQFIIYSAYSIWWGGHSYGPRYCLDLLPACVPAAAAGVNRIAQARAPVRILAGAALAWSIVVAATGAFCYPHDEWNTDPVSVDQVHERLWEVRDSQILRCWKRGLSPQNYAMFDAAAWRARSQESRSRLNLTVPQRSLYSLKVPVLVPVPEEGPVPITWTMDAAAGLVRVRYTDPYTFDEWRAVIEELRSDRVFAFRREIGGLIDRTQAGPPTPEFAAAVTVYIAKHPQILKGRRLAFVVRDSELRIGEWLQAEMFEEAGAISTVFRSHAEAEAWLRDG